MGENQTQDSNSGEEKIVFDNENTEENKKDSSSGNIFEEFNTDESLKTEVSKLKKSDEKDFYFYVDKAGFVFQILFGIMLFFVVFLGTYVFLQKKADFSDSNILNPVCFLFLGDLNDEGTCSSISYKKSKLEGDLEKLSKEQTEDILSVLENIYINKNYLKSKDVLFLKDKTENRFHVIDILAKFDAMKYSYTGVETEKIKCNNITIDSKEKILTAKCEAYAMGYQRNIIGFDGTTSENKKIKGTSISLANSFLNYIETQEGKDFILLDKQKVFTRDIFVGEGGYDNKTPFDLKLKINF